MSEKRRVLIIGGSGGGGSGDAQKADPLTQFAGITASDSEINYTDGVTSAIQTQLDGKQAALGFTAENSANKDTDGTLAANSDIKYASQKATKTYADTKTTAAAALTAATGIKLDDFAAPDDNTDLNASTTAHGLLVKATAPASGLVSYVGIGNGETAYTNKALFDTTNPAALGTVGPGTSLIAARRDHIHALPAIDATGAATDITTRNATTSVHGLVVKATAPSAGLRNVVCIESGETDYKNAAVFDATVPTDLAAAAATGSALTSARRDHVHAIPIVGTWVIIQLACSDTTTAITAGNAKITFRMPFAMTLTALRASVSTAPTGSTILIDLNESGTTVISTKLMIDATEKTSTTAATPYVISDPALADDAEMTVDFDQVGSTIAGVGVILTLIGTRA